MGRDPKLANEAWESLFRAQMTIARELSHGDAWGDLASSEYGVLYALATAKDGVKMSELSEDILLSQAGLSRLVARLEKKGLVERSMDPNDARASLLYLSTEGRHLQRRLGALHGRHVADALSCRLTDDELIVLRNLCSKMLAHPTPVLE
jgi:DNA-binding MarR family transcriptional regulator